MGKILSYKHGEQSVSGVDPRLWDSVQHAIAAIPYDAVIRSGSESRGTSDKGNHMEGYAIDVTLYDPQTGQKLPDTVATSNHGESFAAYEQLAQATRVYQQQTYPELNSTLRWGGGFHQGGTPGDLMHLDITPSAKGSMAYYNWDTGLNSSGQKAFPNAKSNGGLSDSRLVNSYKQTLAGSPGLIPPANVGAAAVAPTPANRPASLSQPSQPAFAQLGPEAMNGVGRLNPGQRAAIPAADTEVSVSAGGVGSLNDPRTAAVAKPALDRALALARLTQAVATGKAQSNTTASGSANLTAQTAPQPMPGRPPDVAAQVTQVSTPQTIRVGKHDYQVGQTFDQGGMHYRVTPTGIESSRIPTGEPTIMSGIIGQIAQQEAPKIGAALSTAASKASNSLTNMGNNIAKTATTNLGNGIGGLTSTLGSTIGNFLQPSKPSGLSSSASSYAATGASGSSTLKPAVKKPLGVLSVGGSVGKGTTASGTSVLAPAKPVGALAGLGGIAGGVGGSALRATAPVARAPIVKASVARVSVIPTVTLAQINAARQPAPVPVVPSQPAGVSYLQAQGQNTSGMTVGEVGNALKKSMGKLL